MEYIEAEDLQTNFIDIGPVNKVRKKKSLPLKVCAFHRRMIHLYLFFSAFAENIASMIVKN